MASSLLLAACAGLPSDIRPLTEQPGDVLTNKHEQELHAKSQRAHADFKYNGLILDEKEFSAYSRQLAQRLIPAYQAPVEVQVYLFRDSMINAFAMPSGGVYMSLGLMAQFENEEEFAFVLAHEISHVIYRHSYKGLIDSKNKIVGAQVADWVLMLGTGVQNLGSLMVLPTLFSFSREQEDEADRIAVDYLIRAGYNPQRGAQIFDRLSELKYQQKGTSIWSTHPNQANRKKAAEERASVQLRDKTATNLYTDNQFLVFRDRFVEEVVKIRLANQQYELALDAIKKEIAKNQELSKWYTYWGDAYRLMAVNYKAAAKEYAVLYNKKYDEALVNSYQGKQTEDLQEAIKTYTLAIKENAENWLAYKGLGLAYHEENNTASALANLETYLVKSPDAKDRFYVNSIIQKLKRK